MPQSLVDLRLERVPYAAGIVYALCEKSPNPERPILERCPPEEGKLLTFSGTGSLRPLG
ncbi:MAG: hypothetical protein M3N10_05705 [Actinomycetota bacterium]|nr:hypothetical protein [Actinomycetota bacterium]